MEQHVLVEYELDREQVDELTSGRSGGWTGRVRPRPHATAWRTVVGPIWPLLLLIGVLAAGVRAISVVPASMWTPLLFDLLRLVAIATPIAVALMLIVRRLRRPR